MRNILDCGLELVPAVAGDLPYVASCLRESIVASVTDAEAELSDLWVEGTVMIALDRMSKREMSDEVFVLTDGKDKLGMLWLGVSRDQYTCEETGYVLGIFVDPALRKKGVGGELMRASEEWCRNKGLFTLELDVGSRNSAANSFYASHGYYARSSVLRKDLRNGGGGN